MRAYSDLAKVYDEFMQDSPVEDWIQWFDEAYPDTPRLRVVDVGCGTGKLSRQIAFRGHQVWGVDLSPEMLAEAAQEDDARHPVQWLCQDMRHLDLPLEADLVMSSCDGLNYLENRLELLSTFQGVYTALRPGGRFCFDILGPLRIETLRDGVWYDVRPDAAVLFTTDVYEAGVIQYDVTLFQQSETKGLYRRMDEQHKQCYFEVDLVRQVLEEAGFSKVTVVGDFGKHPTDACDRLVFSCFRQ